MLRRGWKRGKIYGLWVVVILVSGLSSLAGFTIFDGASDDVNAFILTFSAGALLTMVADTMMPEAFEDSGVWSGLATALGFGVAFWLGALG